MELLIDTTGNNSIKLAIKKGSKGKIICQEWPAHYDQAEILLARLQSFLRANRLGLSDINCIAVNNRGGSFSALRIGVVTANALGYALAIPVKEAGQEYFENNNIKESFSVIQPKYDKEPNITKKNL